MKSGWNLISYFPGVFRKEIIFTLFLFNFAATVFSQTVICGPQQVCLTSDARGNITWLRSFDQLSWTLAGNGNTLCFFAVQDVFFTSFAQENSCDTAWSDTAHIVVSPAMQADAGTDDTVCQGEFVTLGGSPAATGGIPPYTYTWSPATGLNNNTISNPAFTANFSSAFLLTVTDSLQCQATDTVMIDTFPQTTTGSDTFNTTGSYQYWVVPPCVTQVFIQCWGAAGGKANNADSSARPGYGGHTYGDKFVNPGDTLWIYAGGKGIAGQTGGWNGGGDACTQVANCGSGGGATDVRYGGWTLSARIIVAGGGGGLENTSSATDNGGDGGGLTGGAGNHFMYSNTHSGGGGTQSAGGAAGAGSTPGQAGIPGFGGGTGFPLNGHTAGGGGGFFGGGGSGEDGHGGGGSSFYGGMDQNFGTNPGVNTGDGKVVISW